GADAVAGSVAAAAVGLVVLQVHAAAAAAGVVGAAADHAAAAAVGRVVVEVLALVATQGLASGAARARRTAAINRAGEVRAGVAGLALVVAAAAALGVDALEAGLALRILQ